MTPPARRIVSPRADRYVVDVARERYRGLVARLTVDPQPVFTITGRACRSETLQLAASAYVLEFSTVLVDVGVHVESVYVAGRGTHTRVTDLYITGGEEILATRQLERHPVLGETGRLRCLRDHLER